MMIQVPTLQPPHNNLYTYPSMRYKSVLVILGLIVTCIALVCLIYITFIYYYVSEYVTHNETSNNINVSVPGNGILCNESTNGSTDPAMATLCSVHGIGVSSGCTEGCTSYSGLVCTAVLAEWQSCALTELNIYISSTLDQHGLETELNTVLQYLSLASEECQQVALPLICLYTFPLCDCTSLKMYKPTRDMCEEIRDSACQSEWAAQTNHSLLQLFPDCTQLLGDNNFTRQESCEKSSNSITVSGNITCHPDFIEQQGACWPLCREWKQDHEQTTKALVAIKIASVLTGTILTVLSLLLALICEPKRILFKFPNCLVVFILIDYLALAVFTMVSSFSDLFCTDIRLDISQNTSSAYCTVTGVSVYYVTGQMVIFWITQASFFFYSTTFNSHAESHKKDPKRKAISLLSVMAGLFFPAVPVLVVLVLRGSKYVQNSFPVSFCTLNNFKFQFYSLVIPCTLMLSVGSVMLLISLWVIHKHQGVFVTRKRLNLKQLRLTGQEKRILLVLVAVIAFVTLAMAYVTHLGVAHSKLIVAMEEYFICERQGYTPGRCNSSQIEMHTSIYLEILFYIGLGTVPLSVFIFVLDYKHLLQICRLRKTIITQEENTTMGIDRVHNNMSRPPTHKSISQQYILSRGEMDITGTIPEEEEEEDEI